MESETRTNPAYMALIQHSRLRRGLNVTADDQEAVGALHDVYRAFLKKEVTLQKQAAEKGVTPDVFREQERQRHEREMREMKDEAARKHVESGDAAREEAKLNLVRKKLQESGLKIDAQVVIGSGSTAGEGNFSTPHVIFESKLSKKQKKLVRSVLQNLPFPVTPYDAQGMF